MIMHTDRFIREQQLCRCHGEFVAAEKGSWFCMYFVVTHREKHRATVTREKTVLLRDLRRRETIQFVRLSRVHDIETAAACIRAVPDLPALLQYHIQEPA